MPFRPALLAALLCVCASDALAQCAGRLGTSRTITIDPARHSAITGAERSLGLKDREVILTFDDGPLMSTRKVLAALERECVRATFFVVGRMARHHGALLRRIATRHTVGHHSWGHERLTALSSAKAARTLDRGVRAVNLALHGEASARPRVPFFRSPYLARNARTHRLVRARGMVEIGANIDTEDWKRQSPAQLHDRIMRRLRRHGRGIVLLHDIQSRTAKMLPRLLRSMRREGFRVVHMVPPRGRPAPPVLAVAEAQVPRSRAARTEVARPTRPTGRPSAKPAAPSVLAAAARPVRTSPSVLTLVATPPAPPAPSAPSAPSARASEPERVPEHPVARPPPALRPTLAPMTPQEVRLALRPTLAPDRDARGRFVLR